MLVEAASAIRTIARSAGWHLRAHNYPCPRCHGALRNWTDDQVQESRTVRRIKSGRIVTLVAGVTVQVTNDERVKLEQKFKAPAAEDKLNLLACSPTLEFGIDVGGLEAIVLRNVPPRPDNYASWLFDRPRQSPGLRRGGQPQQHAVADHGLRQGKRQSRAARPPIC